jgi:hypothetical protein
MEIPEGLMNAKIGIPPLRSSREPGQDAGDIPARLAGPGAASSWSRRAESRARSGPVVAVALSYRLGADSTAILLRWLAEPAPPRPAT